MIQGFSLRLMLGKSHRNQLWTALLVRSKMISGSFIQWAMPSQSQWRSHLSFQSLPISKTREKSQASMFQWSRVPIRCTVEFLLQWPSHLLASLFQLWFYLLCDLGSYTDHLKLPKIYDQKVHCIFFWGYDCSGSHWGRGVLRIWLY